MRLAASPWYLRFWVFLVEEQSWLFLFVLGTFGALVVLFLDFSMDAIIAMRTVVTDLIFAAMPRLIVSARLPSRRGFAHH